MIIIIIIRNCSRYAGIATAVCYVLSISTVARAGPCSFAFAFHIFSAITVSIFRTYFMQRMSEQQCRAIRYTISEMRYVVRHQPSTADEGAREREWERREAWMRWEVGIHFYYYFAFRISRDKQELRHHRVLVLLLLPWCTSFSLVFIFLFSFSVGILFLAFIAITIGTPRCDTGAWRLMATLKHFHSAFSLLSKIKYWRRWHLSPANTATNQHPSAWQSRQIFKFSLSFEICCCGSLEWRKQYFIYFWFKIASLFTS